MHLGPHKRHKIGKIEVILMGAPGSQGGTHGPRDGRQILELISGCKSWYYVRALHGQKDMGPPMDYMGGLKLGSQKGGF